MAEHPDDQMYKMWLALFELDDSPEHREQFDSIKDDFPKTTLSTEAWAQFMKDLGRPPRDLPKLRELIKRVHPDAHEPSPEEISEAIAQAEALIERKQDHTDELATRLVERADELLGEKEQVSAYAKLKEAVRDPNEGGLNEDGSLTEEEVRKRGKHLHSYANHFDRPMWKWTRDLDEMTSIRYSYDVDTLWGRIKQAAKWLFRPTPEWMSRGWWEDHVGMAWYSLRRDKHMPDGQFREGPVYAVWEEDGEYIQMVQPVVGSLIAEFLMECPEHPHAQKIAAKLREIAVDYSARLVESVEQEAHVHVYGKSNCPACELAKNAAEHSTCWGCGHTIDHEVGHDCWAKED